MEYIKEASKFIFTDKCFEEYFDNFNFFHQECFKATLSKSLGLAIIAGSVMVKVPQVMKIFHNKSSQGINFISVLLDVFATTAMVSYSFVSGFPFSAWGDGVFIAIQTLAIALLCLHYGGRLMEAVAFFFGYLAFMTSVITGLTPLSFLWACQTLNIPVVLISKLFQAYTNFKNGSTGQLSAATIFLLFFGSLARIFTSYQETGDSTMILLYICATSANAVLASQVVYYWNTKIEKKKKKNNKKNK